MRLKSDLITFQVQLILGSVLVDFIRFSNASLPGSVPPLNQKSGRRLAPCQTCRTVVGSFNLGLERTSKGHYGGGDTAWEEENKKDYKNSELRLVEIQEALCNEVSNGKDQCHEVATENEHLMEDWWHTHRNQGVELMPWLCIDQLKVCCPENHYGAECQPCLGHPGPVCSGHGKCKGSGTRKGNGECNCDKGYTGRLCDSCSQSFYESFRGEEIVLCSPCHKACQGGCTDGSTKTCVSCNEGWETDEENGCLDINECLLNPDGCTKDEFCVNNEGSYSCIQCDKSCNGCSGDGPDFCDKCADGYFLNDKICIELVDDEHDEGKDVEGEIIEENSTEVNGAKENPDEGTGAEGNIGEEKVDNETDKEGSIFEGKQEL